MEDIGAYVSDIGQAYEGLRLETASRNKAEQSSEHSDGKRICLNERQMQAFAKYTTDNRAQKRAHDTFMLCFYLYGASIMDVIYLRREAYRGKYLKIKRHLSDFSVIVPIDRNVRNYLKMFESRDESSPYLLNFLDGVRGEKAQYNKYRAVNRSINRGLEKIADAMGLPVPFTIFCARNTFAYLIRKAGNPIDVITRALGLSNVSMTRMLLDGLPE